MGTAPPREPAPPGRRAHTAWAMATAVVAVAALLVGAGLHVFRSLRRLPTDMVEGTRQAARELREVAAAFRTGTVTTSFLSYATEVQGVSRLQFAELRQLEVFERRDEAAVLWGALRLPDVVVQARAPVEYTYFLDLDKEWRFRLEGSDVWVVAPAMEWNRPAVDVSALRFEVSAGSVFRDERLVEHQLRDELTGLAALRARQHLPLVREAGRRKVEAFVENWLVHRFADGEGYRARVRFADEPPAVPPRPPAVPSPAG